MLNNALHGSPGMNRAPQNMGMGPMGPSNMGASPQPPMNWREMMNKNAAQQRMYHHQMGPQMHQGQRMGGGGGPNNKSMPMRGKSPNNRAQQGVKFQKVGAVFRGLFFPFNHSRRIRDIYAYSKLYTG